MNSVWTKTVTPPEFSQLDKDVNTDVLIIGGGIAGILCAYKLRQAGIDCVLTEADRIGGGITKNTTAKITCQHGVFYKDLIKRFNRRTARLYLEANREALEAYRTLCKNIDCDFENASSYVYTTDDSNKISAEYRALREAGISCRLEESLPLPVSIAGAIRFDEQAQFHPLKFLYALSRNLTVYEHTKVQELALKKDGILATTPRGVIKARKVIAATHFPFLNKHGAYYLKMYQHRSYVIALENVSFTDGMYVDEAEKGMSFRKYKNLLFIGGGGHRTGKSGGNWAELERFAKVHFSHSPIRYRWAAQDCMSLDGVPYIGPYASTTEGLYVATGFNKWGMTSSMVAAMILSDQVQGKENHYSQVFSPSRSILHPKLIANGLEAAASLLTPRGKRCPHLGCALSWNAAEHSWDCPCHGSRFTEDGQLIDNPATDDLKK